MAYNRNRYGLGEEQEIIEIAEDEFVEKVKSSLTTQYWKSKVKMFFLFHCWQARQINIQSLAMFYDSDLFKNNKFVYDRKRKMIVQSLWLLRTPYCSHAATYNYMLTQYHSFNFYIIMFFIIISEKNIIITYWQKHLNWCMCIAAKDRHNNDYTQKRSVIQKGLLHPIRACHQGCKQSYSNAHVHHCTPAIIL